MKTKNAKRSRRANFLAVCAVLLAVLWGGGLFLGCENTAGGGSSSRSSSGSSSGGSTAPLQVPPTADMIDDLFDSSKGGLTDPNDKKNIEDFLNALSGPAKEALERNGWTSKSGEAVALKNLADTYANLPAGQKGTTDDPVKLLNDLASNNNGKDNGNKSSDLDGFLKDTANKSGGQIDTTNTLQDLQKADGYREAVLKALSGTSPNAATSAGEAKSTALNTLEVTSADLYPIIKDLSDTNKNKLASLDNDLIKSLVKDKASKTPTGSNALKDYLNGSGDIVDLTTYKDAIKANYPESNGQTLAQFIQNQKLLPIYQKLGSGDTAKGKDIYDKLKNAGMTEATIAKLADNIKDMSMIQAVVAKATNPAGATALKDYIGTDTTTIDNRINQLNNFSDKLKNDYPSTTGKTIDTFIKENYGQGGATGSGNDRTLKGDKPTNGATVTDQGYVVKPGTPVPSGQGGTLGWVYKVDEATRTAFVVGTPREIINTSSSSNDIQWAKEGVAYNGYLSTKQLDTSDITRYSSGYDAWKVAFDVNPDALFSFYIALKTALIYPRTRSDIPDVTSSSSNSEKQAERDAINAIFNGSAYNEKWYLPSVKELQEIYANMNDLPQAEQAALAGKTFWSANTTANGATLNVSNSSNDYHNYAQAVTFGLNGSGSTVSNDNKRVNHLVLPVAQFKY